MAKTTVVEVFIHYYQALESTLPMKQEEFVMKLQQHNLLPPDTKATLASLHTSRERASYFLNHIIKPELDTHICFDELLTVMIKAGYDDMKELGTKVRSELSMVGREDTTGIVYSI